MLYICFTADHELFFGENYSSPEEVLFKPTYKLMDIVKTNGIQLTLFTDVCSIWRHGELNVGNFAKMMEKQLVTAITDKHDVQLHLHPHWINSKFENGKWIIDKNKFKLHEFGFSRKDGKKNDSAITADKIITKGKSYLEELLQKVDKNYRCVAFRAGGWCLQPERELFKALAKEGIFIDTTIYKGGFHLSETHYFDFIDVPECVNWWVDPERGINHAAIKKDGNIFEVPIGSQVGRVSAWGKKIEYKFIKVFLPKKDEKSRGASIESVEKRAIDDYVTKIKNFLFQPIMFSFDGTCFEEMLGMVKYYLKQYDCENNDYFISMIGHPKTLKSHNFNEIEKFCGYIVYNYPDKVRFVTMSEISKKIIKSEKQLLG